MDDFFMAEIKGKKIYYILFIFAFFLLLILSGCEKSHNSEPLSPKNPDNQNRNNDVDTGENDANIVLPFQPESGQFLAAYGWISDYVFVYATESSENAKVFSYDLKNGKSSLLFESDNPIVSLYISPSGEYILIHSSPSTYNAITTIIDSTGNEIFTKEISSFDLAVGWNPYNEDIIIISTFSETWDYTAYNIHLQKKFFSEITLPQPFIHWVNENEMLYIDWDDSQIQHCAPLKKYSLESGNIKMVSSKVFYADNLGSDGFLLISADEKDANQAEYSFYTKSLAVVDSFKIPHLTSFSGWDIPYFEYIPSAKRFVTFQPFYSASADVYSDKYKLVSYSLDGKQQEVLLENEDNGPLSCSPNGEFCLYGFYFENLLDLKSKEIVPLVKE